MLKRYFGDRAFLGRVSAIALPIIVQNLITNFVSLLDNIMVGQLSTAEIGAVAIINNNLLFIFILCLFGVSAGAGIYTTQFHGCSDHDGVRQSFRFRLFVCVGLAFAAIALFYFGGESMIGLYLQGDGDATVAANTLRYAQEYLRIMLWGLIPFALTNAYASTLRETGHPSVPMVASIIATFINLIFNYILIFGHFGAPALGVAGAATATVIARFVEFFIVAGWTHLNPGKNPFIVGAYRSFYIPGSLLGKLAVKALLLMFNEGMWSLGMAVLNQNYSVCGLIVTPALSITYTLCDLTAVLFRSLGSTVGIILGQMMGGGRSAEELQSTYKKLSHLCVISGTMVCGATIAISSIFPQIYNTTPEVRELAKWFIVISAFNMPLQAYVFPVFFTLRAGGKAFTTILFDSMAAWVGCIPLAFILCNFTGASVLLVYALCNSLDLVRCVIGYFLIRKGSWIQNLTGK